MIIKTHITDTTKGPFYINYSKNGEHYIVGPYETRRFAQRHMDHMRSVPGVSNVYLGLQRPEHKADYRHLLPVTSVIAGAM